MKSFIRTIIVFAALSLAAGSLALAQDPSEETHVEAFAETPEPAVSTPRPVPLLPPPALEVTKPAPVEPAAKDDVSAVYELLETMQAVPVEPMGPYVATSVARGRTDSRKILIIPAEEVKAEDLTAIWQDLYVMSRIFDKKFSKGSRLIRGVFPDYGDFFRRDSRATEAIYIQGYGAIFLMEANFPLTAPPKSKEKEAKKTEEPADPIWQQTKQEIFDPMIRTTRRISQPGEKYDAEQIEEVKKELIKSLKHAANIRNLKPDEWVILTVTGESSQAGGRISRVRLNTGQIHIKDEESKIMRIYEAPLPGEIGFPSPTVLTIRVRKSDVDAFAKGELDYEKFREKVQILTYPYLGQKVGRGHRVIRQPAEYRF